MTPSFTPGELKRLQAFIEQNCGIAITDEKTYLIESRLSPLISDAGHPTLAAFCSAADKDFGLMENDRPSR